jgi:hypothetical protein
MSQYLFLRYQVEKKEYIHLICNFFGNDTKKNDSVYNRKTFL